jgi:hypothetical protein
MHAIQKDVAFDGDDQDGARSDSNHSDTCNSSVLFVFLYLQKFERAAGDRVFDQCDEHKAQDEDEDFLYICHQCIEYYIVIICRASSLQSWCRLSHS